MAEASDLRRLSRRVPAGGVLLCEGEKATGLVILISGTLGVYRGERKVADVDEPGSYLGEGAVFSGGPHSATVRAETDATVVCLDARSARAFLHAPDAEDRLVRNLADRLRATTDQLLLREERLDAHRDVLRRVLETLAELYGAVLSEGSADEARLRTLNTLLHLIQEVGGGGWTDEPIDID